ncbi:MAG: GNAT family N-acetyltransferase [Flavisolibacter sp.]
MIPATLTLETPRVLLRPLSAEDFDSFLAIATDPGMWDYFTLNLADPDQLRTWMEMAVTDRTANTRRPFTIIDKSTGEIAGSMSMGNIAMHDLRLEIGWSWLGKSFRGSAINKHAKFVMMRYAFDILRFERVEFKTDVLNERARRGLIKIGATEEGILRSHMTMWNNRRRTSVYYSVLKSEWPGLVQGIFKDIA